MAPETPPQTQTLQLHRLIRAPRDKVFAAFLDKNSSIMEHFAPNAGPGGPPMRFVLHDLEPRVGGAVSYSMVPPDADIRDGHRIDGAFLEIIEPERIVQSQTPAEGGPATTVTFLFEEADGGTLVTIRHEGIPDPDWAAGAKHGWSQALQNLAAAWEAA